MENHVKNQHYVPQFLLRCFSNNNRIWSYDKLYKKREERSIKNVASEEYFYDTQIGQKENSFEYLFQKAETEAAPVVQKIIALRDIAMLTEDEKCILALFTILQLNRTKSALSETERMNNELIAGIRRFYNEANVKEDLDFSSSKDVWFSMFNETPEFSNILLTKVWVLFESENKFYTSDNPVVKQNYANRHKSPHRGILGVNSEGIEIYFPLCPSLVLGLLCEKTYSSLQGRKLLCDAVGLENMNHLQVLYSDRFIFASTNDFWLVEDMIIKGQV